MAAQCLIATSQTWPSTAALPALFEQAGATVVSFSPGSLGLSGSVSERIRCSREARFAAAQLRNVLSKRSFDAVVIADEILLAALIESGEIGSNDCEWLPIDPSDRRATEIALSKFSFVERASEIGIRIPESRFACSYDGAAEIARAFGYPVVLKGDRGFAGSQVRVCRDAVALRAACTELLAHHSRIFVQRYVRGYSVSVCVTYARGRVAAYKAYRAECCYPDAHSASTVHTSFDHPSILATARALGEATGFHGLAGIDFMCDGDELYALEINPRPTIGFTGTVANRAFFSESVRALLAGRIASDPVAYRGESKTETYFPGHLFYIARHLRRPGPAVWHRVLSCLREARLRDAKLFVWEISRFVYDELKRGVNDRRDSTIRPSATSSFRSRPVVSVESIGTGMR